jgi:hypothetical protein
MCFFYLLRIKENNFYSISGAKVRRGPKNSPNIHILPIFVAKKRADNPYPTPDD